MKVLLLPVLMFFTLLFYGQSESTEIYLWDNGAPDFEQLKNEPQQAEDYWVKNIHNPSITAFHPENPNGTSVVIFPGGGHRLLVYTAEGVDPARYFNNLGITAFVLKYRLAREEGSPYILPDHARQDAYRAMRYIRANAEHFKINPDKIGVMGFSAGGEVAAMVAYGEGQGDKSAPDPIDRENGKPNFQILVYPGPLYIPDAISRADPPGFIVAAFDDPCCSTPSIKLLQVYHQAGVPMEAHVYAKGGHAFNMGYRSDLETISSWPDRLTDWFKDNGWIGN